ncbi:MAG TPA: type IV pilus modification protein PilV [Rhodanobacter sp.]|nr:type IV pilus modification protein PilV [Rhodanobacter sp.]
MQVLSRQRGVSLIEVLVAMLIFSIGVLGIALMQIKGSQFSKQAGGRTVAVLQARSLADAMRANLAGVYGVASEGDIASKNGDLSASYYLYDGTTAPNPSGCSNDPCQQAKRDLLHWLDQLKSGTAKPTATVTANTDTGALTITSGWADMTAGGTATSASDAYKFDFQPQWSGQ